MYIDINVYTYLLVSSDPFIFLAGLLSFLSPSHKSFISTPEPAAQSIIYSTLQSYCPDLITALPVLKICNYTKPYMTDKGKAGGSLVHSLQEIRHLPPPCIVAIHYFQHSVPWFSHIKLLTLGHLDCPSG